MNEKAMTSPTDFDAANRWLSGRVNVLTNMTSKEIALSKDFQGSVRAHSFFSAKVAESKIIDKLRSVSDEFSSGKLNKAEARTKLKTFLHGEGYSPDNVATGKGNAVSNLASTARLDLILTQNARMAAAVGADEVSFDPDIMERFPYFRYVPSVSINKRQSHIKYYNTVLPKNDPFWHTHTPPIDFHCKCSKEDLTEEEAAEYGVASASDKGDGNWTVKTASGRTIDASVPESGFVFDVAEAFKVCDMSRIQNMPQRRAVFASLRDFAHANPATRFKCVPGRGAMQGHKALAGELPENLEGFIAGQIEAIEAKSALSSGGLELGKFSDEMKDALGLDEKASVFLSKGSSSYGLEHSARHHLDELKDGRFAKALNETFFAKDVAGFGMEFTGKKVFLNIENKNTGAFASALKTGEGWNDWQIVSAHYPEGSQYTKARTIMRGKQPPGP